MREFTERASFLHSLYHTVRFPSTHNAFLRVHLCTVIGSIWVIIRVIVVFVVVQIKIIQILEKTLIYFNRITWKMCEVN